MRAQRARTPRTPCACRPPCLPRALLQPRRPCSRSRRIPASLHRPRPAHASGATLGDVAADAVHEHARTLAARVLPAEHAKFVPLLVQYGTRAAGVSVAFVLQRFAAAAHSALRGSQLLTDGAIAIAVRTGHVSAAGAAEPQLRTALQLGLAALGVAWQWRNSFGVPFPLNVLLLPLSMFEAILIAAVGL
mgnify:CR=1 FL=1